MRLHSLFSVPPTTQAVKLVEAIDLETIAAIETSKISPPETAVTVVVTASPRTTNAYHTDDQ